MLGNSIVSDGASISFPLSISISFPFLYFFCFASSKQQVEALLHRTSKNAIFPFLFYKSSEPIKQCPVALYCHLFLQLLKPNQACSCFAKNGQTGARTMDRACLFVLHACLILFLFYCLTQQMGQILSFFSFFTH